MNKIEHLKMIQQVIERMARNSFILRSCAVALLAALIVAIAIIAPFGDHPGSGGSIFGFISLGPVICFWFLDGFFLSQERLYRSLYESVCMLDEKDIDFSMNTSAFSDQERNSWQNATLSKTVLLFYAPIHLAALAAPIYLL